jgi:hypothetical protein
MGRAGPYRNSLRAGIASNVREEQGPACAVHRREEIASDAQTREPMEGAMNTRMFSIAAAAGMLIGTAALAQTRGDTGTSGVAPGHEMQEQGGKDGPGASGFAPDRDDRLSGGDRDRSAPLRGDDDDRTNGFGGRDDRLRGDREDQMMDQDTRGIDKE